MLSLLKLYIVFKRCRGRSREFSRESIPTATINGIKRRAERAKFLSPPPSESNCTSPPKVLYASTEKIIYYYQRSHLPGKSIRISMNQREGNSLPLIFALKPTSPQIHP